jgi:hypothetical protein
VLKFKAKKPMADKLCTGNQTIIITNSAATGKQHACTHTWSTWSTRRQQQENKEYCFRLKQQNTKILMKHMLITPA